jgi:sugar lactone lactonase YvrE
MQVLQRSPTQGESDGPHGSGAPFSEELVIKEARRRRRRRWLGLGITAVVIIVAVVALNDSLLDQVGPVRHQTSPRFAREKQLSPIRPTRGIQPVQPGPLAVGSNGDLYIADGLRNQILERQSDGRFRVLVGTGKTGFSGDGGPATNAEINDPEGMAVAPDGTLYFADSRNGRIRAVSPNGTITTVAGDGQSGWVADGTPALSASLTPVAVTLSPTNQLYVADQDTADQGEILRFNSNGTFTVVLGIRTASVAFVNDSEATETPAFDPDALAFDSAGDLFVAGYTDKALLMVSAKGIVTYPLGTVDALYPRGNGGLVTAPGGSILAMDELSVSRLTPSGAQTVQSFPLSFLNLHGFSPDGLAVASNGNVYVDTYYGNGFAFASAIVELAPNGKAELLWKAAKPSP